MAGIFRTRKGKCTFTWYVDSRWNSLLQGVIESDTIPGFKEERDTFMWSSNIGAAASMDRGTSQPVSGHDLVTAKIG